MDEQGQPGIGIEDVVPRKGPGVRCAWVISGAPFSGDLPNLGRVPEPDKVVAADGGAALAAALGLIPDLLIGDFDSIDPRLLNEWQEAGVELRRYEHNLKSETDTELAILAALEWQPDLIIVLGAIGGRLDHTLANVLLLTHPALAKQEVRIVEGHTEIYLARPGRWNPIEGDPGDTVSLLPVGGDASGVSLMGLAYPLNGETLVQGAGRGVSNVLDVPPGSVRLESGLLLVVVEHADIH